MEKLKNVKKNAWMELIEEGEKLLKLFNDIDYKKKRLKKKIQLLKFLLKQYKGSIENFEDTELFAEIVSLIALLELEFFSGFDNLNISYRSFLDKLKRFVCESEECEEQNDVFEHFKEED